MAGVPSDALVIFGATGDLAFKKIFPALHAMVKRGRLDVPVVTVGRDPEDASRIHDRARKSIETHGGGVDAAAFEKLAQRLSYVGGDYAELATFAAIRAALGAARHPTFYLAIPPSAFALVVRGLARTGCAEGGRVVLEKPFGRDLASARELNRILHEAFEEQSIFRIDHYLGKTPSTTCCTSASPTPSSSRCGIASSWRASRSRWPRASASRDEVASTKRPVRCATSCRTTCSRPWRCSRWSRPSVRVRRDCATRRRSSSVRSIRSTAAISCAASSAAIATRRASPPTRRSRRSPRCTCAWRAGAGRAFRS